MTEPATTRHPDERDVPPDPGEVGAFALHVWGFRQGEVVAS
jgi:hypothetical protein